MSIKILGGVARGFPLAAPRSESTRPTSVMIKRKLFDWRQNLEGFVFIDLCAGSGAMGFEALSRGAEKIVLNDAEKGSFLTLKKNREDLIRAFRFAEGDILVGQLDARKWIERELTYLLPHSEHTILYVDPPYENHALYRELLTALKERQYAGEVWVESDRLKGPKLDELTGLFRSVIKLVEQGDHFVVVGHLI